VFGGGSSLQLFRIAGIRVGIHPSWLLILFLWIYWLQSSFEATIDTPNRGFVAAVLGAFLFFGSILLHELGHAFAARREGIGVTGVELVFFGGYTQQARESRTPGEEFRVTAAGPAATLAIALVAGVIGTLMMGWSEFYDVARLRGTGSMAEVLLGFTAIANAVLLVFNLVPAYPLDGGRIAHAIAWRISGNQHQATRLAANLGQGFAVLLMGFGVYELVVKDSISGGLWYLVLGWMLGGAARAAVAQSSFQSALAGVTAADIMDAEPVTIPASLSALRAYDEFFLRYQGWPWFAVVEDDGHFAGLVHRASVQHAALDEGGAMPVRTLVADSERVPLDTPLESLVGSEPLRRLGALMAVDGEGRLRGVVTLDQVSRALQARLA